MIYISLCCRAIFETSSMKYKRSSHHKSLSCRLTVLKDNIFCPLRTIKEFKYALIDIMSRKKSWAKLFERAKRCEKL